jgi:hypothetical protein
MAHTASICCRPHTLGLLNPASFVPCVSMVIDLLRFWWVGRSKRLSISVSLFIALGRAQECNSECDWVVGHFDRIDASAYLVDTSIFSFSARSNLLPSLLALFPITQSAPCIKFVLSGCNVMFKFMKIPPTVRCRRRASGAMLDFFIFQLISSPCHVIVLWN